VTLPHGAAARRQEVQMTPASGADQPAVEVEEDGSEVVLDLPESEATNGEAGADDSYSIESPDEALAATAGDLDH
jgi:hypothetical protein